MSVDISSRIKSIGNIYVDYGNVTDSVYMN